MNTVNTTAEETTDQAMETRQSAAYQFVATWQMKKMQPSLTDNQLLKIVHTICKTEAQCNHLTAPTPEQINLAFKSNMKVCIGASAAQAVSSLCPTEEASIKAKADTVTQALKDDCIINKESLLVPHFYEKPSQQKAIEKQLLTRSTMLHRIVLDQLAHQ